VIFKFLKPLVHGSFQLKEYYINPRKKIQSIDKALQKQLAYRDELITRINGLKEKLKESTSFQKTLLRRIEDLKGYQHTELDTIEHNSKEGMNSFFNDISNTEPYTKFGTSLRMLVEELPLDLNGTNIADVGVGPAIALNVLLKDFSPASVNGFDFSNTALDYASNLMKQAVFECHNIYEPLPRSYDFVLCSEVLEHLENPELAYKNLQKAVSPGGSLLITVPNGRLDRSAYHINFWSPESWEFFIKDKCELDNFKIGTFTSNPDRPNANNYALLSRA